MPTPLANQKSLDFSWALLAWEFFSGFFQERLSGWPVAIVPTKLSKL